MRLISRIAIAALLLALGPRPTWLTTVALLLAYIGIVLWSQRDALRNPKTWEKRKKRAARARCRGE